LLCSLLLWLGGEQVIEFPAGEAVYEGQDNVAIKKQPFAFTAVGDIRELMRGDIELLGENLPVAAGLIEHEDEIAVLKDVLHLAGGEQVVG